MSRIFDGVAGLRARLGPGGRNLLNRALYEAIYSLPAVARLGFFNSGFHPAPDDMPRVPELAGAPLQAAFYDLVLRVQPDAWERPPGAVLDIGCGLGGGLLMAARLYPQARLAGVDTSRVAVMRARGRLRRAGLRADLRVSGGHALPFPDGAFDFVASLGTLTYVGYEPFLREAARVLAPGGRLSVTGGTMDTPVLWTRARLAQIARQVGLEPLGVTDITPNCLAALEHTAAGNAALLRGVPGPLRRYGAEWASLPGSRRHAMYLDGTRKDFAALFAKPG